MNLHRDYRLLVVDDTKTNIDILIRALGDDYKLAVALTGAKAIEIAESNAIDLILLDIMMPELDGFQVCARLKKNPATAEIPIIFITAMDAAEEKSKGFAAGAVDYITKPFDILEVKARVKTHLFLKLSQEALKDQNRILEEKVKERTRELADTQIEILQRLGLAAEQRDNETGQHIKRMSEYCRLLGKAAGLSQRVYNDLALASAMHDVGKIGVSDTILLKPGKLTEEEYETMKTHSMIGAKILSGSNSKLLKLAETICLTHHEKWDGTGYPRGLKGKKIPLIGRIACICDVFDAIVSDRPYKKAWPIDKSLEHIRSCSETFFDPVLTRLFVSMEDRVRDIIKTFGLN